MLILVTKHKQKIGFFSRRKAKLGKIPPVINGIHIGAFPAAEVALVGNNHRAHLSYLAPYVRRGDVLVGARGMEDFGTSGLTEEYARRQCVNLALDLIRQKEKHRPVQTVLIDKEGECVGVAAELLKVCNTVWVAAKRPELFAPCAAYTLERYGNEPLMVRGELPRTDLVVAPYGMEGWQYNGGLLFSPQGGIFPKNGQLYLPDYAHLPDFDPAAVTAGVFAAFQPKELMTALPNMIV